MTIPTKNKKMICLCFLSNLIIFIAGGNAVAVPAAALPPQPHQSDISCSQLSRTYQARSVKNHEILFNGNKAISSRELRGAASEELKSFEQKQLQCADIDDAAFQMELFYRQKGHAFAKVEYGFEIVDETLNVTFNITEGPRVLIREINLIGNTVYSDDELKSYFYDKKKWLGGATAVYIRANVRSALDTISTLYHENGYLDAKIGEPLTEFSRDRSEVAIAIEIAEGTQYLIHSLNFSGDMVNGARKKLDDLVDLLLRKPYYKRRIVELESRIFEIYGDLGYSDAQITITERPADQEGHIALEAQISAGPKVTIGKITVRGNQKTRLSFVKSRLHLSEGDLYSLEKKRRSFMDLYRSGLFKKIEIELEQAEAPERDLLVRVEEALSRELYFEPGWGSYEYLRFKAGILEKNLLGTGRLFKTEAGISFKARSVQANITDPWFLNTALTADLPIYHKYREEPSFIREENGISLFFSKQLQKNYSTTAGYIYRHTAVSNVEADISTETPEDTYNLGSIKLQLTKDTRNDIFFPTSGYKFIIGEEYGDAVLGSEVDFSRLTTGIRTFFAIRSETVLAFRYDTGLIIPVREQITIPLTERFFNGGENTVRGFRQDRLGPADLTGKPVGGMAYNVFNIELRQYLTRAIALSLFFDYGNVAPNQSRDELGEPPFTSRSQVIDATLKDYFSGFRSSVGFGFQYLLPVGPARLDFGFNPDQKKDKGEDRMVIHFSVGMAF